MNIPKQPQSDFRGQISMFRLLKQPLFTRVLQQRIKDDKVFIILSQSLSALNNWEGFFLRGSAYKYRGISRAVLQYRLKHGNEVVGYSRASSALCRP